MEDKLADAMIGLTVAIILLLAKSTFQIWHSWKMRNEEQIKIESLIIIQMKTYLVSLKACKGNYEKCLKRDDFIFKINGVFSIATVTELIIPKLLDDYKFLSQVSVEFMDYLSQITFHSSVLKKFCLQMISTNDDDYVEDFLALKCEKEKNSRIELRESIFDNGKNLYKSTVSAVEDLLENYEVKEK
ncbi:MAG: hypothetical protein CMH25_01075 [Micavibrio sp.]|nr:hypothetical protein [Micavibrio sp.]|tara:strand:+ start:216645 stop:217205 length:561 start_codon:yes stop_codon:yes gene_type:complete